MDAEKEVSFLLMARRLGVHLFLDVLQKSDLARECFLASRNDLIFG